VRVIDIQLGQHPNLGLWGAINVKQEYSGTSQWQLPNGCSMNAPITLDYRAGDIAKIPMAMALTTFSTKADAAKKDSLRSWNKYKVCMSILRMG